MYSHRPGRGASGRYFRGAACSEVSVSGELFTPFSPRAQRHYGSPSAVDSPGTPAPPPPQADSASTGRNPRQRQSLSGRDCGAPPWSRQHVAGDRRRRPPPLVDAPIREVARRGRGHFAGASHVSSAAGVPHLRLMIVFSGLGVEPDGDPPFPGCSEAHRVYRGRRGFGMTINSSA